MVYASTTVTTTGSAGSATGSTTLDLPGGWIEWIDFDFGAAPATTDTTITYTSTPPRGTIATVTNSGTDITVYPRAGVVGSGGSAITDSHTRFVAGETVTISVAQADALAPAVTVTFCIAKG